MKYILLRVIDKDIYHEYYCSHDLNFLKDMCVVLNKKYKDYFFIVEVLR